MQICTSCGFGQNRDAARFCARCGGALPGFAGALTGMLPLQSILKDRYIIERKLGQGGMGAVYQARDVSLVGKAWAIKEMSVALIVDPVERQNAIAAFQREGQFLATLDHPNLPQVADLFERAGNYYLVMDYVNGQTLEQINATAVGFLPEATVLGWGDQLCDVLEYLHTRTPPIIFRDLKPANIMLTREGRIKLIDFGIARFFQAGKTKDTAQYGTMGYAAPEQFGTGQTDARSDVYGLGVTLHNLLTRHDSSQSPFNLPPPRQINPQMSLAMETVILRATRHNPLERFQSAQELRAALRAVTLELTPEKIAQPDAPPKREPRSKSLPLIAAGLVGAMVVLALFVFAVGIFSRSTAPTPIAPLLAPTAVAPLSAPTADRTAVAQEIAATITAQARATQAVDAAIATRLAVSPSAAPKSATATATATPPRATPTITPRPIAEPRARLDPAGTSGGVFQIVKVDLATNQTVLVYGEPGIVSAAWSPDGSQILVTSSTPPEPNRLKRVVRTVDANGGNLRTIHQETCDARQSLCGLWGPFEALWTPDGKRILVRELTTLNGLAFRNASDGASAGGLPSSRLWDSRASANDIPRFWSVDEKWVIVMIAGEQTVLALEVNGARRMPIPEWQAQQRRAGASDKVYDQRYFPWKQMDPPTKCKSHLYFECPD